MNKIDLTYLDKPLKTPNSLKSTKISHKEGGFWLSFQPEIKNRQHRKRSIGMLGQNSQPKHPISGDLKPKP
jgi:hypothetical protein